MNRPLRVVFLIPGDGSGSSMVFARRQAEAVRQHGVAVELFHLHSRTSPRELFREARRFRQMCRSFVPQVIHAHFGTMTALFAVLASPNVPVVITYRGSDLNHVPSASGPRAWLGRLLSQFAALGAGRIVCVSRKLRDQLWWRRSIVTVLPSGVDTSTFCPAPRSEARRTLGWRHDDPVVLFNAGHDPRNKRLDLAQAAFALVREALPQARLEVLAGDTPPASIPAILNASDCLLVTSDAEGSPTVVQEALACNLPIVSVDTGDVAERLQCVSQTVITPRDPKVLATAIVRLLRAGARSDGRSRAREIDSAHIASELVRVYLETLAPVALRTWNTTLSSQR